MTAILGISAYYHDSAACVVIDGVIVAAAQEERFSRKKHDPGFPTEAIKYCLKHSKLTVSQLDAVVFYDKPLLKFERLLETYLAHAPKGFISFARSMPVWLKQKLYLKSVLRRELRCIASGKQKPDKTQLPPLLFTEHHQSHAASAYFPSPYDDAAVICLDGVGEWTTSSIWHGQSEQLSVLQELHFPHSLGLLYSAFTYYCGFRVNAGEYKLMGLAPYGQPRYAAKIRDHLIDIKADGSFRLNMRYFDYAVGSVMISKRFEKLFGQPRLAADQKPSQFYCDIASSIQLVTEEIVIKIANHAHSLTQSKNVCLAGGVALNCVANGKILANTAFENIWIQPAAGDAGGALGAALMAWYSHFQQARPSIADAPYTDDHMHGAQLGPEFSDTQVQKAITAQKLPAQKKDNQELCQAVADLLAADKVVGWFQGRMEFGPRALGNRSILGDARSATMQRKMNIAIKQRESFRPFAPVVMADLVTDYFAELTYSPYMLLTAPVKPELRRSQDGDGYQGLDKVNQIRSTLPAITHIDYSARVQTVSEQSNPSLYRLMQAFHQKTGTGVLINTSFNVRGEPPVCSPEDAIRCFLATEMDYLVMGPWILDKTQQPESAIRLAKSHTFEKD